MKRNQLTTLAELQLNDRFYIARDNTKKVWQLMSIREGFYYVCLAAFVGKGHQSQKLVPEKGSAKVVFLCNHTNV